MIQQIEESLPGLRFTRPIAGMFLMLWAPDRVDGWEFFHRLIEKHHVAIVPGAPFFLDGSGGNTLRLNFSRPRAEEIPPAIESISRLLKDDYST